MELLLLTLAPSHRRWLQYFQTPNNLPSTYYRISADALAEINAIADIANYRNIGYPNTPTNIHSG